MASLSERRVRVVVNLLEDMGLVARQGRRLVRRRDFASADEFQRFLTEYEDRRGDDRRRLDAMMRWAESTACRWRSMEEWFGEEPDGDRGHCDNCRDQPARALAGAAEAASAHHHGG